MLHGSRDLLNMEGALGVHMQPKVVPLDSIVLGAGSDLLVGSKQVGTNVVFKDSAANGGRQVIVQLQSRSNLKKKRLEGNHHAHSLAKAEYSASRVLKEISKRSWD